MTYLEARLSFKGLYQASWLHFPLCSIKEQDYTKIAARGKNRLLIDVILFSFPGGSGKLSAGSHSFTDETMTDTDTYSSKNNVSASSEKENNIYERG